MKIKKYGVKAGVFIFLIIIIFAIFARIYVGKTYDWAQGREMVEDIMRHTGTPGTAIVTADKDQIKTYAYGYADYAKKEKVTKKTMFEIGSTTKAFTALSILMLEGEGKLNVKDNASKYIPGFYGNYEGQRTEITIEQLIMHKSGISPWSIALIPNGTDSSLLKQTVKNITGISLNSRPGTHHEYATVNYDVLALIIQTVTQMPYQDYVKEMILNPLGMTASYFSLKEDEKKAQGYKFAMLHAVKANPPRFYGNIAAGYLVTNAEELSKWLLFQMGELKAPDSMKAALEKSHFWEEAGDTPYYWAGWEISPLEGTINHGGNNPDFSSQVFISLAEKKAVFVLCNMNGAAAEVIGTDIMALMNGESVSHSLILGTYEMVDMISVLLCFAFLCAIFYILRNRGRIRKTYIKWKVLSGLFFIVLIIAWPWMLHYSYFMLWVWFTPLLMAAQVLAVVMIVMYLAFAVLQNKNVKSNMIFP